MKTYKIKFFGAKERRAQLKQFKMEVQAKSAKDVEQVLRNKGFLVVQCLKIRLVTGEEERTEGGL